MRPNAKLKTIREDFVVKEITNNEEKLDFSKDSKFPSEENRKDFIWCDLIKKEIDHFTAIKEISKILNIPLSDIGYAGTKDKNAITIQKISIFRPDLEKLKNFSHQKITLKNFSWNKRKIKMGYLGGNYFKITLRDIDKKEAIKAANKIRKTAEFPNYFGKQRFGIKNKNADIGKLILKRKFDEAVKLILEDSGNKEIYYYLSKNPGDFLGAIKRADRKNILILVNAVQSKIFNEILERALEERLNFTKKGMESCILPGYKTRFYDGHLGEIEKEVLKNNNLALEDFDVKEIPYLRIKGGYRKALVNVKDLSLEIRDDEMFEGSKKIILEFSLPSGVYATTFLEQFFEFG